jgi:hypothetical protein
VTVDIAGRDRDGRPIDRAPWVDAMAFLFVELFGGAYELPLAGHWKTPLGDHIREDTTRVGAFGTIEQIRAGLSTILAQALVYVCATRQQVVLLTLNGHPHFLTEADLREALRIELKEAPSG